MLAGRTTGVQGNERLTATTGLMLLVLLAIEGFTVLSRQSLVVGSVLLGLVVAVVFLPLDSSWVHWLSLRRFGG